MVQHMLQDSKQKIIIKKTVYLFLWGHWILDHLKRAWPPTESTHGHTNTHIIKVDCALFREQWEGLC